MRSRRIKKWLVIGVVPAALTIGMGPAEAASNAAQTAKEVSAANLAGAVGGQYVVVLRNQNSNLGARSSVRRAAVRTEQAPLLSQIRSFGGRVLASTTLVNAVVVKTSKADAEKLAADKSVAKVFPNQLIPGAPEQSAQEGAGGGGTGTALSGALCGTAAHPQLNPEALNNIDAVNPGADGAGVTVALLADGLNPADPDFQRNPAYASPGSPAGSPVVTEEDFSTDGTNAPTDGAEAYIDSSSIAAQGNETYDLSQFVSTAHPLPSGCDIKIRGVAPGANVLALKVFAQNNDTTTSGFFQAINYAVAAGAKVINESFSSDNFPDLAADAVRMADDAAVAAGVTVVACSYDAGYTNTFSPPSTDPNVISVGASTTFRSYEQDTYGGVNAPGANGRWVDNNISSLSSGGVSEAGGTLDLVAPGDLNWILCDPDDTLFTGCTNENGAGTPIQLSGGTSESSPLTAGAAADVIQAYAQAHGGTDPSPALVKQILMSTATDIDAPATQQGAGLLNVAAAVRLAKSIGAGNATPDGGLLVSPGQVNVTQGPGATATRTISVTNTSSRPVTVNLSTRALTDQVGSDTGTFCIQPGTPTAACPANTGSFRIWSGVTEVYQLEHFTVPTTSRVSRLSFSADYADTGQTSDLHFALLEPDGTYAGYSLPQGLADYGNVQVANPPPGRWTAVFFTEQDDAAAGAIGTSGTVQWEAATSQYAAAAPVSPSTLNLAPGQTRTAALSLTSPSAAGDTSQSVVVSSGRHQTTVPVVVRTAIATNSHGGTFSGTLTGGNGRASWPAQENDYVINVPPGTRNIHADITLANDPNDLLTAYLIDPSGQDLGYSTNVTVNSSGTPESTLSTDLYHADPQPGQWTLILTWANPVSGLELSEPFTGTIAFNQADVHGDMPMHASLRAGTTYTYDVTVHNTGSAPETFFVDPRLRSDETLALPNQNGAVNSADMTLPLPASSSPGPYYFVPAQTSQLQESLTGSVPVDFDSSYFPGDPDIEGTQSGDSASATLTEPEVSPGFWDLNPDEVGPYLATGAPTATASASMHVVTQAFDPAVTSSTGDLWSVVNGLSSSYSPVYVPAGATATITVQVTPSGAAGSLRSGTLFVDDETIAGVDGIYDFPNGDEIAAIPYSYKITG